MTFVRTSSTPDYSASADAELVFLGGTKLASPLKLPDTCIPLQLLHVSSLRTKKANNGNEASEVSLLFCGLAVRCSPDLWIRNDVGPVFADDDVIGNVLPAKPTTGGEGRRRVWSSLA